MPDGKSVRPFCPESNYGPLDLGTLCLCTSETATPVGYSNGTVCEPASALVRGLAKKWQCDDDVRSEIGRVAKKYNDSLRWREDRDRVVKCSRFVDDVLGEVFGGALGHHLDRPPRIGGWRGKLAHVLEVHVEKPWLHDLGERIREGRNYAPLAGDWAIRMIDIPMWPVVQEGSAAAQPGDIVSEWIFYMNATGHVGIVVEPGKTASADSTATPPGKITISDYGFRSDEDKRERGHSKDCTIRRFSCPSPS